MAPHLAALDKAITDGLAGRGSKRLIVCMPPRHGKSWLISRYLPAWFLGTYPDKCVMLAGYGAKFARVWGTRALAELSNNGEHDTSPTSTGPQADPAATNRVPKGQRCGAPKEIVLRV
jgi:hypothetical protein